MAKGKMYLRCEIKYFLWLRVRKQIFIAHTMCALQILHEYEEIRALGPANLPVVRLPFLSAMRIYRVQMRNKTN